MSDKAPLQQILEGQSNGVTIAADDSFIIGEVKEAGVVTGASFTPEAASTGDNTNFRTFTVVNKGQSGSGTAVVGTIALLTGNNLVAFDEKAFVLSVTPADLVVAAGDILALASIHTASGLVDPGGKVKVEISRS